MKIFLPRTTQTTRTKPNLSFGIIALLVIGVIAVSCENPFFPDAIFKGEKNSASVTISPEASYVFIGDAIKFSAVVNNSENKSVTWSVSGDGLHADTGIDLDGLLSVSKAQNTGVELTVKAVSDADSSKFAALVVTVIGEDELKELISITGENKAGETLTIDTSKAEDGEGEYTYKWKVDGEEAEGKSGNSYTITEEDEGKEISCEVTYTTEDGTEITVVIIIPGKTIYNIEIDLRDNEEGDTVTANPTKGIEGKEITLSYNVASGKLNNILEFDGIFTEIESVTNAGSGTRKYIIDPEDAINEVITIIATFTHTDLTIDHINFTDETPIIHATYGDDPFTNAIKAGHLGTGAITYSSEAEEVATVDNYGEVTIHKAGRTIITAEKAADAVYAHSSASYPLEVKKATLTVTVKDVNIDFNDPPPVSYEYTITGFLKGDSESSAVTGAPYMYCVYEQADNSGTYEIIAKYGTLSSENYDFSFINGSLIVTKNINILDFSKKNTETLKYLEAAFDDVGSSGLQDTAQDIQEIDKKSEGLWEIISVMENIASQTNLMSMNAAIEAAHAGDAGKVFAVVADEIRKLAEAAEEQSKTIRTVINKILGSTGRIKQSINNTLQKFDSVDYYIEEMGNYEKDLRNAAEGNSWKISLELLNEQYSSWLVLSTRLSGYIEDVQTDLQEIAGDIQEIVRESEGLKEIINVLENIASQINLLSMNAAIEAAHAGNSGFVVVAGEFSKLAENLATKADTAKNVINNINESIEEISQSTDSTLDKFEDVSTLYDTYKKDYQEFFDNLN